MTLKSFPRGGKKPTKKPHSGLLFKKTEHVVQKAKKNRGKRDRDAEPQEEEPSFVAKTAESLTYSSLAEGMVVFGRIQKVTEYDMIVSLPGRLSGRLPVTDVSNAYTNLLQSIVKSEDAESTEFRPLPDLYKIGGYIVCYVKSLNPNERWQVSLSLEPELINRNLDPSKLCKGSKITGTISSVEDHGYVVDTGIDNLRTFLGIKDIDEGAKYYPGKQVFCAVKSVKTTENSTTAQLSTKAKHLANALTEDSQTLDALVPGTRFVLSIENVLSNGLQVSFNNVNVGYVNRNYLEKPLSSYEKGRQIPGTLMYVMPTVKFAYFTLLSSDDEKERVPIGEIFESAKVLYAGSSGIVFNLKKGIRGLVPFRRTTVAYEKIHDVFAPETTHKCRVIAYDALEQIYVCTMERELLEQKHISIASLVPGEPLEIKIARIQQESGYLMATVGKTKGWVPPEHVNDVDAPKKRNLKVGDVVKARVLGQDRKHNGIQFTLKKSLIDSRLPVLHDIKDARVGGKHHGTVVQINKNGLLIRFFDQVRGWVPAQSLDRKLASVKWNFMIGQTIVAKIEAVKLQENKLTLSVFVEKGETKEKVNFEIGEAVEGTVVDASVAGVYVRITKDRDQNPTTGFLPAGHIAPCEEVGSYLSARYAIGDSISALVFSTSPRFILSRTFVPQEQYRKFENLKIGDCLPCSIHELSPEGLKLILPVDNFDSYGTVAPSRITNVDALYVNQILFAKITVIDKKHRKVSLTTALHDVWNVSAKINTDLIASVDVLTLHLNKLKELSEHEYYKSKNISKTKLGERVKGVVDKVTEHGLVLKLENDILATVRQDHYKGTVKAGDKVNGSIIWINYIHELAEVTLLPNLINALSTKQSKLPEVSLETQLRGEIVLVTNWFVLVILKGAGKGSLAALPSRRHINDSEPDLSPYSVGKIIRCFVVLNRNQADLLPICLVKSSFEAEKIVDIPSPNKNLKRKAEITEQAEKSTKKMKKAESEDKPIQEKGAKKMKKAELEAKTIEEKTAKKIKKADPEAKTIQEKSAKKMKKTEPETKPIQGKTSKKMKAKKEQEKVEETPKISEPKKTKRKKVLKPEIEEVSTEEKEEQEQQQERKEDAVVESPVESEDEESNEQIANGNMMIPECGFYWDNKPDQSFSQPLESSSDDDEDDDDGPKPKKKKKLSAAERRELEKQKEREIREREEALASNQAPNSVDQFDRLVLASPDSSMIWLQYMAYHLQATEIEKARAVAKRAIKTINFREEGERLNVWQAWLNLESRFGSAETLNGVFQEAVRTNDAIKIYLHMLTVHSDAGRQNELEKIVTLIIGKFKQNAQVWVECGSALLKMGLKEKSRHIMQRAIQSLPAQEHVNLMVKFAQMENKFGDKERAQTLFEQILSSYPKRVDVWSSYVDALVKSNDLDVARKVLDRAVVQTLPARKMKTLFKKFIDFEEKHGTEDGVSRVRQLAAKYVENQCSKELK